MSAVLVSATEGTPLHLIEKHAFADWLAEQPETTQTWITQSAYRGSGLSLIPGEGGVAAALHVVESVKDFFACGQLATSLPAGQYVLQQSFDTDTLTGIAFGWGVGAYRFDRYTTKPEAKAVLALSDDTALSAATKLVEGTCRVRDLINTPASDMMPQNLSAAVSAMAQEFGAEFTEVVGDDLLTQNYPMIHAVGRASVHPPRLLDLRWGDESHPMVTLVGKGICFDSGGLNLKPGDSMRLMKKDMGGAANAFGLAYLIMAFNLPVRLRLLVAAAENAVSGNAFRPGDVLPTRKGLTVEIDNTDAEGRLVLCDALFEGASESPQIMIDFATLTGACRVALGTDLPGFFTNQKPVAQALMETGETISDPVWNMPLHRLYKEALSSDVADLVNSSNAPGGAITAALYLEAFVGDCPWVHFDIMAWNRRAFPGKPVGGEAMGIRAVFQYLSERYSSN